MPTLADLLRGGYKPPTESALADPIKEHFRNLPQTTAQNAITMNNMVQNSMPYNFDPRSNGVNPNYDPQAAKDFANYIPNLMGATAYHGTPHTIQGAFSALKGGSGQGTQNFGHGTYFAESPEVAKGYINAGKPANTRAKTFLELHGNDIDKALQMANQSLEVTNQISPANRAGAIKSAKDLINELEVIKDPKSLSLLDKLKGKTQGNLYKVDIPDEKIPNMLNWYENVPEDLRKRLSEKAMEQFGSGISPSTGERLYKEIAFSLKQTGSQNPQIDASKWLVDHGVTGVKYENFQIKKGQGAGTHNYVVFEPSDVKILEKNGIPTRKDLIQQQIDKIE
jgi:hypothetical protein